MTSCDFLVVGAGIAGATAAYGLSPLGRVIVLERESLPGYHTTGRSAAFYAETYGNAAVRALTSASKGFLLNPPKEFTDVPLVRDRGAIYIARADQRHSLEDFYRFHKPALPALAWLEAHEVAARLPLLKSGYAVAGVYDPECRDIDVNALHQGFLRAARANGAELITNAGVLAIARRGAVWQAVTGAGDFEAPVLVNAAGAWADELAGLAGAKKLALAPKRRTVIMFPAPPELAHDDWPLALDVDDQFYLKPEHGQILATPGDATPMPPQDVQPDEMEIALTVDRLETAFDFRVAKVSRKWAGLRTFAPDDTPVIGFDAETPGFFWCAGQGGYGMQTAAAIAAAIPALASGKALPETLTRFGVTEAALSPRRFRRP